jgi:hypothetical protein
MARNRGAGSPWMMISAVVVALVVVLGLALALTGGSKKSPSAAGDSAATPSATAASGGSTCAPSDTDTSLPVAAPAVSWQLVDTVALPVSTSAGPLQVDGPVARCYAHTPRGALMAALNLFYRAVVAAPSIAVLQQQAVPGAGTTLLEQQIAAVTQPVQPGDLAQIAGYRIVSYTPQTTVVTLVNGSEQSNTLKSCDVTVQWSGGDWKLVVGSDGSISSPATSIPSMAGYTPFGGV